MNHHLFNTSRGDRANQAAMLDCVVSSGDDSTRGIPAASRTNASYRA